MEQRDYVKKQIDLLGKALGKILSELLNLKTQGTLENNIESSLQSLKSELNFDVEMFLDLPSDQWMDWLTKKNLTDENLEILATIFLFMADNGHKKKIKMLEMSLIILEYLEEKASVYSMNRYLITKRIKESLNSF